MTKLKSEGKCVFCKKLFSGSGIGRHLSTHLKKMEKEQSSSKKAYHLKIPGQGMFLHLLVNGSCTFSDIDSFLRAIWLECCGHLSSFQIKGKSYDFGWDATEFGEDMSKQVSKVFTKGIKIQYEYDFGSTTQLEIEVVNVHSLNVPEGILLMSRNEPLPILCHICNKKPATTICSVCIYEGACMFCNSCAKKHKKSCSDFEEYAAMPVVNSPRMGVCAYDGGTIDQERDGVM